MHRCRIFVNQYRYARGRTGWGHVTHEVIWRTVCCSACGLGLVPPWHPWSRLALLAWDTCAGLPVIPAAACDLTHYVTGHAKVCLWDRTSASLSQGPALTSRGEPCLPVPAHGHGAPRRVPRDERTPPQPRDNRSGMAPPPLYFPQPTAATHSPPHSPFHAPVP